MLIQFTEEYLKKNIYWLLISVAYIVVVFVAFWRLDSVIYPVVAFPFLFFIKAKNKEVVIKLRLVDLALFAIFIYEIANYLFSSYPPNSFSFLLKISVAIVLYMVWALLEKRPGFAKLLLLSFALYGGLLSIVAILQFINFNFSLKAAGFRQIHQFKNIYSPFGIPINDWSTTIWLLFVPGYYYTVTLWRNKYLRYPLLLSCIAMFSAMTLTFSRGIYITILFFLICLPLLLITSGQTSMKKVLIPLVLTLCLALLSLLPIYPPFLTTVRIVETPSQVRSATGRLEIWERGLMMVKHNPLLGLGSGNFAMRYPGNYKERPEENTKILSRVNNTPIQILIDKGFSGLLLYVLLLLIWLYGLFKTYRNPHPKKDKMLSTFLLAGGIGFLIKELTFTSLLNSDGVLLTIVLWIAASRKQSKIAFKHTLKYHWFLLLFIPILLYWGWIISRDHSGEYAKNLNEKALEAASENRWAEAGDLIDRAIDKMPGQAVYHLNKGLFLLSADPPPFSVTDILNKLPLTFSTTRKWDQTTEVFKLVLQLNPNDPIASHNMGWIAFYKGELMQAKKHFEDACFIDPNEVIYNLSKALLHYHCNEDSLADFHFYRAVKVAPQLLESLLWEQVRKKNALDWENIYAKAVEDLKKEVDQSNSPIWKARLAKALIQTGDIHTSRHLLESVTDIIPNMNRPWLNLGDITINDNERKAYYTKSEFLDQQDYLPKLKLAGYYNDMAQHEEALFYYIKSLPGLFQIQYGLINEKLRRSYNTQKILHPLPPRELFYTITPSSDPANYCLKVSELFGKMGNSNRMRKFKKLSNTSPITQSDITRLYK
ncbi:hypothetical protein FNH22_26455 [Fulvivirga sp. M361]|uniref:O-antigen ligase family protein n=1 Tax=Fulvivirga sp. M361 TaxID=2594266 RepID=UPI00117B84AC|nr:O-antigen ligase family protein [Fulvivirga sp. M361]TRX49849.1 hypothetical protein FNH22_26455 [Fulvivirga sp. M361]